jgi:hypothetical protein
MDMQALHRLEKALNAATPASFDASKSGTVVSSSSAGSTVEPVANEQTTISTDAISSSVDAESSSVAVAQSTSESGVGEEWLQYTDPSTGRPYFHNFATGATQWETPSTGTVVAAAPLPPQPVAGAYQSMNAAAYAASASFSANSGAFAATGTGTPLT